MDIQQLKASTLSPVDDSLAFYVCRGDRITSISDMANCIESLSDDQFHVHVSAQKNDVAAWVKYVLRNEGLAKDLNYPVNVENKAHFVKTIRDHVHWLKSC